VGVSGGRPLGGAPGEYHSLEKEPRSKRNKQENNLLGRKIYYRKNQRSFISNTHYTQKILVGGHFGFCTMICGVLCESPLDITGLQNRPKVGTKSEITEHKHESS